MEEVAAVLRRKVQWEEQGVEREGAARVVAVVEELEHQKAQMGALREGKGGALKE